MHNNNITQRINQIKYNDNQIIFIFITITITITKPIKKICIILILSIIDYDLRILIYSIFNLSSYSSKII
jgi:hypothetical protein